jgi:hypothetical protein
MFWNSGIPLPSSLIKPDDSRIRELAQVLEVRPAVIVRKMENLLGTLRESDGPRER